MLTKMMTPKMLVTLTKRNERVKDEFATDVTLEEMRENYIKERRCPEPKKTIDLEVEGPFYIRKERYK